VRGGRGETPRDKIFPSPTRGQEDPAGKAAHLPGA